jgi:signal transduction histidine kinase
VIESRGVKGQTTSPTGHTSGNPEGSASTPVGGPARTFRFAILQVILTCSLLGIGLSLSIYWNHSRLRRIEESGRANVEFVKHCQRGASRSAGVALNTLDLILLPGLESISSFYLEPILRNAQFLHAELQESVAGRGLVSAVEAIAPESLGLHDQALAHLASLESIGRLTTEVIALCRSAVADGSSVDNDRAASLSDELVVALEGSDDAATSLSTALEEWMERQKSRQTNLAILCSVLYLLLVLYLMIWAARAIAQPIERMERALDKSAAQASSDLEFSSFKEINSLRDTLIALVKLRDTREEDLRMEVQEKVDDLLKREVEVQHLQRIEQLGGLAGAVAHDFRNLLTVISGYAGLVAMEDGASPAVRENIAEVLTATRRATDLTTKLLSFSKREETGAASTLSVNEWFENCGVLLSPFGGPTGNVLSLECAPDLPNLIISRVSLDQIMMNLVSNAREALAGGEGLVEVVLSLFTVDAHGPLPEALAGASSVVALQVKDNGMGIPEESQGKVFERYYSTKEGTGFGLATVREIVENAGGAISLESTVGVGTTFTILLRSERPQGNPA